MAASGTASSETPSPAGRPVPTPPCVIGLVGGVASGKSTVARLFDEAGFVVLDADREARAVLEAAALRPWLIRNFGDEVQVSTPEGSRVDRRLIADRVFRDAALRRRLEQRVHPAVAKALRRGLVEARGASRSAVLDVPLLLESGYAELCDYILFIEVGDDERQRRAVARGMDIEDWKRREAAQLSLDEKRRRADRIVPNEAGVETARTAIADLLVLAV